MILNPPLLTPDAPEGIPDADHCLLVLWILDLCGGQVDETALHWVPLVAEDEHIWATDNLGREQRWANDHVQKTNNKENNK